MNSYEVNYYMTSGHSIGHLIQAESIFTASAIAKEWLDTTDRFIELDETLYLDKDQVTHIEIYESGVLYEPSDHVKSDVTFKMISNEEVLYHSKDTQENTANMLRQLLSERREGFIPLSPNCLVNSKYVVSYRIFERIPMRTH
ncbi:hypothetical protein [Geomicrobium sp. JCM 19055]|uniref:hypothetical protein n=1 Tax=Geomicrobium sp. JCM 19055 TaxID=1460649 RepID=UPI00045EDB00|nr:hypothetical protein [Geomicrobium sp. JCM 19055]GAK00632.1 hypothetical protein JCM19055_3733 [Geomicrobium sp. JCM 19055]